jgi:hypothetical protein
LWVKTIDEDRRERDHHHQSLRQIHLSRPEICLKKRSQPFHSTLGDCIVELTIEGAEPGNCKVVILVNVIPRAPEEAVARALEQFRRSKQRPWLNETT